MYKLNLKYGIQVFALLFFIYSYIQAQNENLIPYVVSGRVERVALFESAYIPARCIDIWLPASYDAKTPHAVLYMHDGAMLFDSSITWNNQEWGVDETITQLMGEQKIGPVIVVGIWNAGRERHSEYFPEKAFNKLSAALQDSFVNKAERSEGIPLFNAKPRADAYLKFLVNELKPYMDAKYSTLKNVEHTFIAGASMGGLISMYALCEYPTVFGGAACMSTHWPGGFSNDNLLFSEIRNYMKENLPVNSSHRLYFDYGTETLDEIYEPYQQSIDSLMMEKGYSESNWKTMKFEGDDHSEKSWSKRFRNPILFLVGKRQ
jgi:enterochelin esterase-like enzyme